MFGSDDDQFVATTELRAKLEASEDECRRLSQQLQELRSMFDSYAYSPLCEDCLPLDRKALMAQVKETACACCGALTKYSVKNSDAVKRFRAEINADDAALDRTWDRLSGYDRGGSAMLHEAVGELVRHNYDLIKECRQLRAALEAKP